jgi:type VI secretion system secreted protein VgrG
MIEFFENAIVYVLENEDGYVDDKDDGGGATNHGITRETLSTWLGRPASPEDVKALTRYDVLPIYQEYFWKPLRCDKITVPPLATIILDAGVLFGVATSALFAQKAAIACGAKPTALDGVIGSTTLAAINSTSAACLVPHFQALLLKRIARIIEIQPKSKKYQAGWESRVNAYSLLLKGA